MRGTSVFYVGTNFDTSDSFEVEQPLFQRSYFDNIQLGQNHGFTNRDRSQRDRIPNYPLNNPAWSMNNHTNDHHGHCDQQNRRNQQMNYSNRLPSILSSRFIEEPRDRSHRDYELDRFSSRCLTYPKRDTCMFEKKQSNQHQQDAKYSRKVNKYRNQSIHSQRKSPSRDRICRKKLIKNIKTSQDPAKREQKKEENKVNKITDNQPIKPTEPPCSDLTVVSMDLGSDDESNLEGHKHTSVPKNTQHRVKKNDTEDNTLHSKEKEVAQTEVKKIKKSQINENNNNTSLILETKSKDISSSSSSDNKTHKSLDSTKKPENIRITDSSKPRTVTRDPRLPNKNENESKKEQDSNSSVFDSTNTDKLSDPRIHKKVDKNNPLVLKVPNFWAQWKRYRMKKKAPRKQQGSSQITKQVRKRNIKNKSSVCLTNIAELRKYTEIPIKGLLKFCCHVSVRRDECKSGPLQNLSDSRIKSLIDTKKSYLTEADTAKKVSQTKATKRSESSQGRDEKKQEKKSTGNLSDRKDRTKEKDNRAKHECRKENNKLEATTNRPADGGDAKREETYGTSKITSPPRISTLKLQMQSAIHEVYKISKVDPVDSKKIEREPALKRKLEASPKITKRKKRDKGITRWNKPTEETEKTVKPKPSMAPSLHDMPEIDSDSVDSESHHKEKSSHAEVPSTKCGMVSEHSTPAEATSERPETKSGEMQGNCEAQKKDVEYSLHIPECAPSNSSPDMEQLSSEELIKVLDDQIESIFRDTSKKVQENSPSPSSDSENPKSRDASVVADELLGASSEAGAGESAEKGRDQNLVDKQVTPDSSNDPDKDSSQDDGVEDFFEDEGDEMLLQVRVITNPEVKEEPAEEIPCSGIDLFGLQPEIKAEEPQRSLERDESSNGICQISPANSPDVCVADRSDAVNGNPSAASGPTTNEANCSSASGSNEVGAVTSASSTVNVATENATNMSQQADTKESDKNPLRVIRVGDFTISYEATQGTKQGLLDGTNANGTCEVSKNPDNANKQTQSSQNSTEPLPVMASYSHLKNPVGLTPSTSDAGSFVTRNDQTNTQSTAHSSCSVTQIPNVNTNTGGQVGASPAEQPPIDVRRRVPQLSNLSRNFPTVKQSPSSKTQQPAVTPDFAHRVYKILNCYITANFRFANLVEMLESLNKNFNIEQDIANIRCTAARMRSVFGSMLLTNMRTLPPNVRNFDVFANYFMEFLGQMIQNNKSKPYMSKFLWELVSAYWADYETNDTLRKFRNFIENDVRVLQSLNDSGMTGEQYVVLRSQICQYVRSLKTSKQHGAGQNNKSNENVNKHPPNQKTTNMPRNTPLDSMMAMANTGNITRPTVIAQRTSVACSTTTNQNVTYAHSNIPTHISNNAKGNQTNVHQKAPGLNNNKRPNAEMAPPNVNIPHYTNVRTNFQHATAAGYQQLFNHIPGSVANPQIYGTNSHQVEAPPQKKRNIGPCNTMCNNQRAMESNKRNPAPNQLILSLLSGESAGVPRNVPETSQIRTNTPEGNGLQPTSRYMYQQVPATRGSAYPCNSAGYNSAGLHSKSPNLNGYPGCCSASLPQTSGTSNVSSQCNSGCLYPAPAISSASTVYNYGGILPSYASSVANSASYQPVPPVTNAPARYYPTTPSSNASPGYTTVSTDSKPTPSSIINAASSNLASSRCNPERPNPAPSMPNASPGLSPISPSNTPLELNPTPTNAPPRCHSASLYPTPPISNPSGQCSPYATPIPNVQQPPATEEREDKPGGMNQNPMDDSGITTISDDEQTDVKPANSSALIDRTALREPSLNLKDEPDEIIDLTWLDDEDVKGESLEDGESSQFMDESLLILHNRPCLCGKIAEYLCSCNTVMYCSQDCQFEDWINHQKVCPSGITMG
ncbi:uncharacterized protein LOC123317912 isoform X2 [Coccinella septempunctata]|uniref:uncharacterized protein LOC123317912 isoform X2 n=1 Tax=Coccinella septempunctata TaxID=41139 RepID=UPI001D096B9B|nr:uncharacterized protein LOC123317912 isoform X2 [Coccinella septempunctata]